MSKTRNNTNTALNAAEGFTGPREKTNSLATIAVTALASHKSQLTISQYETTGGPAKISQSFTMVGGTSYNFGQVIVLPFFNVTIINLSNVAQNFTLVNTVLKLNPSDNSKLQFVDTQTEHATIQGTRGNILNNVTLAANGRSPDFDCSTYGNNCVISYQDDAEGFDTIITVEASETETGNNFSTIGAFTSFVSDTFNRYSFAGIRLASFKRIRVVNKGTSKSLVVCSLFSS